MTSSNMLKREPLMTADYFQDYFSFEMENLAADENEWQNERHSIVKPAVARQMIFNERCTLLFLKYSAGHALLDMRNDFLPLVEALEVYNQQAASEDIFFNGEMDEYTLALALLSLALLLHIDLDVFRRLVAAIGANGQDYMLEWLIGRRLPNRPQTTQLLFPKTYARLRDAVQAPPDLQPRLLHTFLTKWYESLDTVWYEAHLGPEGGGFTGYWCWEAAAAAYALGLDDGALQPMRYYPKDLADYAYGRKPQPV